MQRVLPKDHPHISRIMITLANADYFLGDHEAARDKHKRALERGCERLTAMPAPSPR